MMTTNFEVYDQLADKNNNVIKDKKCEGHNEDGNLAQWTVIRHSKNNKLVNVLSSITH